MLITNGKTAVFKPNPILQIIPLFGAHFRCYGSKRIKYSDLDDQRWTEELSPHFFFFKKSTHE